MTNYTLGIDIGSSYAKAVICEDRRLIAASVLPSGGNYRETASSVITDVLTQAGLASSAVTTTVTTGYGAQAVPADHTATDIACHAAGIHSLFPAVRTLIDIGAQYSRVMRLNDDGKVISFLLNEKCAGGSGKFLQVIARILKITVEEIGDLSRTATHPVEFTTACAVFAESEAVSRIAEGATPGDIVAGIHNAMASKIATLATRIGLTQPCAVTGGGARDSGLVEAIAAELALPLSVAHDPQITAALGAALIGAERQ